MKVRISVLLTILSTLFISPSLWGLEVIRPEPVEPIERVPVDYPYHGVIEGRTIRYIIYKGTGEPTATLLQNITSARLSLAAKINMLTDYLTKNVDNIINTQADPTQSVEDLNAIFRSLNVGSLPKDMRSMLFKGQEKLTLYQTTWKLNRSGIPAKIATADIINRLAADILPASKAEELTRYLQETVDNVMEKQEDPAVFIENLQTILNAFGRNLPDMARNMILEGQAKLTTYKTLYPILTQSAGSPEFDAAVEEIGKDPKLANMILPTEEPLLLYAFRRGGAALVSAIKQAGVSPDTVEAVIAKGYDPAGLEDSLKKYERNVLGLKIGQLRHAEVVKALDDLANYTDMYDLLHGTSLRDMLAIITQDPKIVNAQFTGKPLLERAVEAGNLELVKALTIKGVNPMLKEDWGAFIEKIPGNVPHRAEIAQLLTDYQLEYDTHVMQKRAGLFKGIKQLFAQWWDTLRDFFTRATTATSRTYSLGTINFMGKMEPVTLETSTKAPMSLDQEAMARVMIEKIANDAQKYDSLNHDQQAYIKSLVEAGTFDGITVGKLNLGKDLKDGLKQRAYAESSTIEHKEAPPSEEHQEPIVLTMDKPAAAAGAGEEKAGEVAGRSRASSISSTSSGGSVYTEASEYLDSSEIDKASLAAYKETSASPDITTITGEKGKTISFNNLKKYVYTQLRAMLEVPAKNTILAQRDLKTLGTTIQESLDYMSSMVRNNEPPNKTTLEGMIMQMRTIAGNIKTRLNAQLKD